MNRLRHSLICFILNFFIENHSKQLKNGKCIQKRSRKYIVYIYIDMNKVDLKTLKEETLVSSIDMNKRDLKKLRLN